MYVHLFCYEYTLTCLAAVIGITTCFAVVDTSLGQDQVQLSVESFTRTFASAHLYLGDSVVADLGFDIDENKHLFCDEVEPGFSFSAAESSCSSAKTGLATARFQTIGDLSSQGASFGAIVRATASAQSVTVEIDGLEHQIRTTAFGRSNTSLSAAVSNNSSEQLVVHYASTRGGATGAAGAFSGPNGEKVQLFPGGSAVYGTVLGCANCSPLTFGFIVSTAVTASGPLFKTGSADNSSTAGVAIAYGFGDKNIPGNDSSNPMPPNVDPANLSELLDDESVVATSAFLAAVTRTFGNNTIIFLGVDRSTTFAIKSNNNFEQLVIPGTALADPTLPIEIVVAGIPYVVQPDIPFDLLAIDPSGICEFTIAGLNFLAKNEQTFPIGLSFLDSGMAIVRQIVSVGDVNGDGQVDLLDIEPFVNLIFNGEFLLAADINNDGAVDLLDVEPFVALLTG